MLKTDQIPLLNRLYLIITDKCNLSCSHCYRPSSSQESELGKDEIFSILHDCSENRICDQVTITGGEPFLCEHLWDVVDVALSLGLFVDISTNSLLLSERDLKLLAEKDVYYLQVSVDGISEKGYGHIRGQQVLPLLQQKLSLLRSYRLHEKMDLNMVVCVTPENFSEVADIIDLAESHNFSKVVFGEVMPVGKAARSMDRFTLSLGQLESVYQQIREARENPDYKVRILSQFYFGWIFDSEYRPSLCTQQSGEVACIQPNGNICLCPYWYDDDNVIGNVRTQRLSQILKPENIKEQISRFLLHEQNCQHWSVCHGGCPVLAKKYAKGGCDPRCPISSAEFLNYKKV